MVLSKLPRNPAMDGLDLFRRLDTTKPTTPIGDPSRVDAVVDEIRDSLVAALGTPSTIRGWRAQALFASLVAALDNCELMTLVDTGDICFDGDSVKAPDYFLHLRGGRRLLVDVKDFALDPTKLLEARVKFSSSEVDRLTRFATLYGCELFIAIYVAALPMWMLVPISALSPSQGGAHEITIEDAIKRSDLGLLGDVMVGTTPPLEMTCYQTPLRNPGSRTEVQLSRLGESSSLPAGSP